MMDKVAFLSVNDISKDLGVNEETVRRWVRNSRLKSKRASYGRGFLISVENYKEFLANSPKYNARKNRVEQRGKRTMNKVDMHMDICIELNKIYEQKNHDYGDSFHETYLEEGPAMARIRLSDKLNRFKKLTRQVDGWEAVRRVPDESIEDTLLDLANYAIMTIMEMRIENKTEDRAADSEIKVNTQ